MRITVLMGWNLKLSSRDDERRDLGFVEDYFTRKGVSVLFLTPNPILIQTGSLPAR